MTKIIDQFIKDGIEKYLTDKGEDGLEGINVTYALNLDKQASK